MDVYDQIIRLRHELHRHPELSLSETGTRRRLMDFLRVNTSLELHDRGNWFYAVYDAVRNRDNSSQGCAFSNEVDGRIQNRDSDDGRGGAIAFRADMDALPIEETIALPYASETKGVSHKCGHDGHCAALCYFAMLLEQAKPSRTVYLVFQPAEEIGQGGAACAQFLAEEGVQEVYAFHNLPGYPIGSIIVREGLSQPASEGLSIRFQGKESHASSPREGRNPAFAVAELVSFVRDVMDRAFDGNGEKQEASPEKENTEKRRRTERNLQPFLMATVVGLRVGTGDYGISAGEGELRLTLRAENEEDMKVLEANLRERAQRLAGRDGLEVAFGIHDYFPETRNDPVALDRVRKAAIKCGFPLIEMEELWRASEDFGYYTKKMRGAIFYIGAGEEHAPLHTKEYDFEDQILPVAARMFMELLSGSE